MFGAWRERRLLSHAELPGRVIYVKQTFSPSNLFFHSYNGRVNHDHFNILRQVGKVAYSTRERIGAPRAMRVHQDDQLLQA